MAIKNTTQPDFVCNKRPRPPKLPQSVHWSMGLIRAMTDPGQVLEEDDKSVTLYDGFPKAKYHYLIVPRENISGVSTLLPTHLPLLRHMHDCAEQLEKKIRSVDRTAAGFRKGYHAVPSMKRLHLHLVSQDFHSDRMRTPHHWNTFNTEYFIDSSTVLSTLESAGQVEIDAEMYNLLLTITRLFCNVCSRKFADMESLKSHILSHTASID